MPTTCHFADDKGRGAVARHAQLAVETAILRSHKEQELRWGGRRSPGERAVSYFGCDGVGQLQALIRTSTLPLHRVQCFVHRHLYQVVCHTINRLYREIRKISVVNELHGRRDKRVRRRPRIAPEQPLETGMSATLATIVRPEVTKRANAFAQIFSASL